MKTSQQRMSTRAGRLALCIVVILLLAACGRNEPTPEPAPPTAAPTATEASPAEDTEATTAEAEEPEAEEAEAAQAESPLAQPESPLDQPDSPLTTALRAPRTEAEASMLAEITSAQPPSEGMGTLAGVLFSFGSAPGAIPGTQVYLEEAVELDGKLYPPPATSGPSLADGDIIVESNEYGQLFMEVPPGNYFAAVWTIYDWRLVVEEAGIDSPRLITIEEGDQLDLGVLYANWP